MTFDSQIHISRDELAARYGVATNRVTALMRKAGLEPLGYIQQRSAIADRTYDVGFYKKAAACQVLDAQLGVEIPQGRAAGEVVQPRIPMEFRPYKPVAHPRAADIERSQPPMISGVRMTGNGGEQTKWWSR